MLIATVHPRAASVDRSPDGTRELPSAAVNCSFCKSSGLFTYDFKPKPSWQAFLNITHRSEH